MGILDILSQYPRDATAAPADVDTHFEQVAREAPTQDLGQGIAAAFRADETPPFGQMVGDLFGQSNPQQRAGLLNQLVQALGPAALSSVAGGALGRLFGGGNAGSAAATTVTPEQASQLSPDEVGRIAAHAEQQNPSIVDRVGSFYAEHPTLVKSLGAMALSAVLGHMSSQRR
jgi:hypothetical protein